MTEERTKKTPPLVSPFTATAPETLETYVGKIVRLVLKESEGPFGMTEVIGRLQRIETFSFDRWLHLEGRDNPILMDSVAQAFIALRQ